MNTKPGRAGKVRRDDERGQARRGAGAQAQATGRGNAEATGRGNAEATGRGNAEATGRGNAQASDAPRPGGRAAARRTGGARPEAESTYATRGTAALAVQPIEPDSVGRGDSRGAPWLKVAPPMPVSVPRAPFVLLLLLVVVGGVLGILVVNTKVNENAFKLRDLEKAQAELDQQEQDLSKQVAELESPNSLAAQARRLGLVPAGSPAFIRLPDGRIIGVPQPAGGQPSITSGGRQGTGR